MNIIYLAKLPKKFFYILLVGAVSDEDVDRNHFLIMLKDVTCLNYHFIRLSNKSILLTNRKEDIEAGALASSELRSKGCLCLWSSV